MVDDYEILNLRGKGNALDPKSKIIIALIIIIGVNVSIDYFQVFLYVILLIPILILFQPRLEFVKRLPYPLPWMLLIGLMFYLVIGDQVVINVFGYARPYSKFQFIGLIFYRFSISVTYTYILLYSEESYVEIIEALASFNVTKPLKTLLLVINRMATIIQEDYKKLKLAAKSKGAPLGKGLNAVFFRFRILGTLLIRALEHSTITTHSLIARGFSGDFSDKTRNITSEGLTLISFVLIYFSFVLSIPWLR